MMLDIAGRPGQTFRASDEQRRVNQTDLAEDHSLHRYTAVRHGGSADSSGRRMATGRAAGKVDQQTGRGSAGKRRRVKARCRVVDEQQCSAAPAGSSGHQL